MLRSCATTASGQVCTICGVIERPVYETGAVQSERQHLAGRAAAGGSDRRRRSPAAVPAENEAFAAPEIRHLSEQLIRRQDNGFSQRVKIIRQRALDVRNVDGADGHAARLIITDQGKENVVIVRLQQFFEHFPLLVGETVLICHPHGVLDLCVDVQRCDPLTIHGSGRQFVFQLVGIEKNFPQELELFLIHCHNVQPMFFVGRDLDRVHSQHIPPVLQHSRFHALLHIQLVVWMILHDAVDLIGKLTVQRRNRVRDLDLCACVLPGKQDSER